MRIRPAQSLSETVAEAVLAVPGVACLRPGLRDLLLRTRAPRPLTAHGPAAPDAAVFVTLGSRGTVTGLRVDIVVRARHQAALTARAVRAAAAEAASVPPEAVRVNVTGIV
ncbi:Asp23/Gls24 family envelope stress response protein [Streptomyces hydrogenans]|uniref:Asp23/Gls24 family envelope stress response protein n=1 Tax=Streptomyces hydrogenans TaxID=1873719 RepID=UPI00341E1662